MKYNKEQVRKITWKEVKGGMAELHNQTVRAVYRGYEHLNAWVMLDSIGAWRKIRPESADAVTDILTLAAEAKANNRVVHVQIDDSTDLINWMTLT